LRFTKTSSDHRVRSLQSREGAWTGVR
jgi:hypothetical protein